MLQFLVRSALFLTVWRWLKPRLRGMLIALIAVGLAALVSSELRAFGAETDRPHLIDAAFYGKWLIWLAAALGYYFFVERRVTGKQDTPKTTSGAMRDSASQSDRLDEFADGRTPVRSKAEQIIERAKKENAVASTRAETKQKRTP